MRYLIYKFKMMLLYIKEISFFCTKKDLLSIKITPPLTKLAMVGSISVSNGLIFSGDILVDSQLVTFLWLSNTRELSIGEKIRKL